MQREERIVPQARQGLQNRSYLFCHADSVILVAPEHGLSVFGICSQWSELTNSANLKDGTYRKCWQDQGKEAVGLFILVNSERAHPLWVSYHLSQELYSYMIPCNPITAS